MNHTNTPPVRNMAAYLAPATSEPQQEPQPAHHEVPSHDSNYVQYNAQPQPNYPPYLPPKPAEYSTNTENPVPATYSSQPEPAPVASSGPSPSASMDPLNMAEFEDWDKPIYSLFRFRVRVTQLILVLVLFCVNMFTEIEYLDHDAPEVFNVAKELQITPDAGRQHFFTFVTFLAFLVSAFNFLAIALVRCVHPQKPPKSRTVGEIATDSLSTLFLTIGSTLLLNPRAISDPSLSVSTDLRNVACVLASQQDFHDISNSNALYVDYPAICIRSWVSVVFGYLSLATFVITIVVGIHRARKLKLLMDAKKSGLV